MYRSIKLNEDVKLKVISTEQSLKGIERMEWKGKYIGKEKPINLFPELSKEEKQLNKDIVNIVTSVINK